MKSIYTRLDTYFLSEKEVRSYDCMIMKKINIKIQKDKNEKVLLL
jgi:hypothetical protein